MKQVLSALDMRFMQVKLIGQYRCFQSEHLRTNRAQFFYQLIELSLLAPRMVCGFSSVDHALVTLKHGCTHCSLSNEHADFWSSTSGQKQGNSCRCSVLTNWLRNFSRSPSLRLRSRKQ